MLLVVASIIGCGVWAFNALSSPEPEATCEDVTSIDYDSDNDVICTRLDGTTFYTNYEEGRKADPDF